ncbi:MAG: DUF2029 domain-containing protein [Porphyrobacter sp.]|jgi:hypothetical protein|nr:DUF2029 domain-containing protein [Porphyrobacter sp.]
MLSAGRNTGLALLAAKLAAVGFAAVVVLALVGNITAPRQMDFMAFWAAGKLTLAGTPQAAFDIAVHDRLQRTLVEFDGKMPFAYPPPFLLMVTPFALLPYGIAALVWAGLTYAFFIVAVRQFAPVGGWTAAAFPPVLINGIIAQNGLLTGGFFVWGMALLQRRPLAAGLVLGCLVIKPHLGVLLPLALAAGGHWRAFAGAAAASLGLVLLALLVLGIAPYQGFIEQMPLFSAIAAKGLVGWHKMASVYAALRLAGAGPVLAWSAHIAIACAAALIVALVWRSNTMALDAKAAMLAAGSVLISPYIYLYDTALLVLPFIWLARSGEDWRVLAVLWCIPFIVALQNWGMNDLINPAPLLALAMMALIWRRLRAFEGDGIIRAPLGRVSA